MTDIREAIRQAEQAGDCKRARRLKVKWLHQMRADTPSADVTSRADALIEAERQRDDLVRLMRDTKQKGSS